MIVIALGNKARQGKDYVANYIKEAFESIGGKTFIVHWADALYDECRNNLRQKPLIEKKVIAGKEIYYLLTSDVQEAYLPEQVPQIKSLLDAKGLSAYEGMEDKDSLLLQAWGTGLRRKYFGEDYWVKKTLINISYLKKIDRNALVLIPDTRFMNEYQTVKKELNGFYIKLVRWNADGTRFLARDRDNQHQSEIELDEVVPDYTIEALSGDIKGLKQKAEEVLLSILDLTGQLAL